MKGRAAALGNHFYQLVEGGLDIQLFSLLAVVIPLHIMFDYKVQSLHLLEAEHAALENAQSPSSQQHLIAHTPHTHTQTHSTPHSHAPTLPTPPTHHQHHMNILQPHHSTGMPLSLPLLSY